jgi:NAD(P)-dependent dehydrogenase (short-subunit alcohol dehydrogenase family)
LNGRDLAGQCAIVTGASSLLGEAIAVALARRGAELVLVGRDAAALDTFTQAIGAMFVVCDLASADQVTRMVAEVMQAKGRIDIVVNAVGGTGGLTAPVWEITEAEFTQVITANLTTAFLVTAAVLPPMMQRQSGRIIHIGGTYGLRGRARRAAYSAAKFGLRGLVKSAALDAGPFNVTINCVCPGLLEGPAFDDAAAQVSARDGVSGPEARASIATSTTATGRISTAKDVAEAVCFLAGPAGRNITGQDLPVDGGWTQ